MKKAKHIFSLFLALLVFSNFCVPAFATSSTDTVEVKEEYSQVQPRLGHAGYTHYYYTSNGNTAIANVNFQIKPILFPYYNWTVKTSGFGTNNKIRCYLMKNGERISDEVEIKGDQEIQKMPLMNVSSFGTETYTLVIVFALYDNTNTTNTSKTGSVEVWVY